MKNSKQVHQYDLVTMQHLASYPTVADAAKEVARHIEHQKPNTIMSSINRSARDKTAKSYGYYWSYELAPSYPGKLSTRGKGQPRGETRIGPDGKPRIPGRPKKPLILTIDGTEHRFESQVDAAKLLQSMGFERAKGSMFSAMRKNTLYGYHFRFVDDEIPQD